MLDRFRKERPHTIRMGAIAPVALVDAKAIPPDPRHSVLPPPPPNTPPTLSLSTISPSSFPDLLAEHIPYTPDVDSLLTHVAPLEDDVKKQQDERLEHLKLRDTQATQPPTVETSVNVTLIRKKSVNEVVSKQYSDNDLYLMFVFEKMT
ncbi:hypothetical protein BLNAU_9982 [Blattamonas nauphoetae]|uniref:Uncharacterized protein n=1 Tax=Blattamonas nauphoetae TaxID=2049346 RepID=A0ABQ9XUA6_9EUKA|nr:hypothetical protein BLNAU_9982 [Blattamonas nauphoetae]